MVFRIPGPSTLFDPASSLVCSCGRGRRIRHSFVTFFVSSLSASGVVSITRRKKDRDVKSDEWVTNRTSDTSRKRTKTFLLHALCTGTPMCDPNHQNNGKLLNKEGGGVVFGPDKSNRTRCSLCMFRLRLRKGRSDADLNNCVRSKHSEDTIGP